MAPAHSLKPVQFLTDETGQRTGVILDLKTWEALLEWIEDATDLRLAEQALRELAAAGGRPRGAGWMSWEEVREEWVG